MRPPVALGGLSASGNVAKAPSQKVPPPVNVPRYAPEEVAEALRKNHGNKSAAARVLGCERRTVQRYCDEHPEVKAACEEGIEIRVDRVEEKWEEAVEAGEPWAIQLGLRGQGAKRGHGERTVTDITSDGKPVRFTFSLDNANVDRTGS